ncbi:MAG TPA: hypothetical protein VHF89_11390 [Solirubrobacteraceae bacterium]|nr:hypothetical protein [Solirubrobacteraceae bacterium]
MRLPLLCVALAIAAIAPAAAQAHPGVVETCELTSGTDWHSGTWSCSHPPEAEDIAKLGSGDNVTVAADAVAQTLTLEGATLWFADDTAAPDLAVGTMTATSGSIEDPGTLSVAGAFQKSGSDSLFVRDSAVLQLHGTSTLDGGALCLSQADPDTPFTTVLINASFTVNPGAAAVSLGCTGSLTNGNQFEVGPTGVLTIDHPATEMRALYRIFGSLVVPAGSSVFCNCSLAALTGGTVTIDGAIPCHPTIPPNFAIGYDALLTGDGGETGCRVDVYGTFRAGPGGFEVAKNVTGLVPDAVIEVPAGRTLTAPLVDVFEGAVTGGGTIAADVNMRDGVVRPGSSPGTLTVAGDYTQAAAATLEAEVTPSGHDHLAVTGTAALNGTLRALPSSGFDPAATDAFRVLTAGARSGTFSTFTGGTLANGKSFSVDYPASPPGARLTVNVPPPPPTAEESLGAQSPSRIAGAFGLPGTRRCQSRRRFTIRLREPAGVDVASATITVAGKRSRARFVSGRWRAVVDLRGLPKGRFRVRIDVTTSTGRRLTGTRAYRTCATKKRRGRVREL